MRRKTRMRKVTHGTRCPSARARQVIIIILILLLYAKRRSSMNLNVFETLMDKEEHIELLQQREVVCNFPPMTSITVGFLHLYTMYIIFLVLLYDCIAVL